MQATEDEFEAFHQACDKIAAAKHASGEWPIITAKQAYDLWVRQADAPFIGVLYRVPIPIERSYDEDSSSSQAPR